MRAWGSLCLLTPCSLPSCPGLFFFTLLFYSLSITAVALLFIYYTQPSACSEGKVFISLNLILCVCVSIISVLPKVQVSLPVSARPEARPLGVWDILWESQRLGLSVGSQVTLLGIESWLSCLHAKCLWDKALISLFLSLLKCKMRIIIPSTWSHSQD